MAHRPSTTPEPVKGHTRYQSEQHKAASHHQYSAPASTEGSRAEEATESAVQEAVEQKVAPASAPAKKKVTKH